MTQRYVNIDHLTQTPKTEILLEMEPIHKQYCKRPKIFLKETPLILVNLAHRPKENGKNARKKNLIIWIFSIRIYCMKA